MAETKQKKIYLWTIPRSMSTAFTRAMSTVPQCKALNEPYLGAFYVENRPMIPDPPVKYGKTFPEVRANMEQHFPGYDYVFIKEMPGHFMDRVTDESYFPRDAIHTILIRHPVKTLNSFINLGKKIMPKMDVDEEARKKMTQQMGGLEGLRVEQSSEALHKVYEMVTQNYGQKCIILDADDLQRDPEGTFRAYCREVGIEYQDSMVHWGQITPEQLETFESIWSHPQGKFSIESAVNGTELLKSEPKEAKIGDLEEMFRPLAEELLPLYQQLYEKRLKLGN